MKAICEGSGLEHVIPAKLDLPEAALPVAALEPKQILFLTRAGWSALESEPRDFDGFRDPELRRFMVKAASPEGGGLALAADRTLRAGSVAGILPVLWELGIHEVSFVFQDRGSAFWRLSPPDQALFKTLEQSFGEQQELAVKAVYQRNARLCPGLLDVEEQIGATWTGRRCLDAATILQERASAALCFADWDEVITATQVAFAPRKTLGVVKVQLDPGASRSVTVITPWSEVAEALRRRRSDRFWIALRG